MLGAEVAPAPTQDWELGHSRIDLSPVGQQLFQTDDNSIYLGMPVAIQVVGLTHEDEKVMGAMKMIDRIVKQ